MEQDLLLLHDQAGGMDIVVVDKWVALKKRGVLRGHAQVIQLSELHVYHLWALKHDLLSYP
jgi:hypothetical protein